MQFHWKESLIFVLKAAKEKGISWQLSFWFWNVFSFKIEIVGKLFQGFLALINLQPLQRLATVRTWVGWFHLPRHTGAEETCGQLDAPGVLLM